MAKIAELTAVWKNIKEFELSPIQKEALTEVRIALAGAAGSGRHALAAAMRSDPDRPDIQVQSPLLIVDLEEGQQAAAADLIVLLVKSNQSETGRELELARSWTDSGKKVLVLCNLPETASDLPALNQATHWKAAQVLAGTATQFEFLLKKFVPAVLSLLPDRHLALGRRFPLFRVTIARQLINETSFANAAYAFSTGLAEIVPVFDLPLNITDMVILTKSQAFLAYRLGLLVGFSTRWQDYVAEFGSVVGGGFMWRQLARQLVGLIPVWGILPKVAVAYAGTYVVGHTILQWYLTGRHLSPKQIRALYQQAFEQGKETARKLASRFPRLRLGARKEKPKPALPAPRKGKRLRKPAKARICTQCGNASAADARFCQYCGQELEGQSPEEEASPEEVEKMEGSV